MKRLTRKSIACRYLSSTANNHRRRIGNQLTARRNGSSLGFLGSLKREINVVMKRFTNGLHAMIFHGAGTMLRKTSTS